MDEDFIDVTSHNRKPIIIFILLVIVIAVGGYILISKGLGFKLKDIEIELGDTLSTDVNTYLKKSISNTSDYQLDLKGVDINEVGEYTYTVTHNKTVKKGKIIIKDTTAPEFTLAELTIEEGNEDYYLGDFLASCIDLSKPCIVTLKDDKDYDKFKKLGSYDIDIFVADLYGNKKEAKAKLKVVEKGSYVDPRTLDLEYASNSLDEEDFNGKIYLKLDTAIDPSGEESRDKMNEISTIDLESYVSKNYSGYTLKESEIIELYNKSGFIIGYSIKLTIDNGKETIVYVDKNKVDIEENVE